MLRILITGNAGSGKTTLAAQVGARLNLPVFGLDLIVWRPGWKKAPPEERRAAEAALAARPAWVVEGVSRTLLEAAATVVFLALSRRTCLVRALNRKLPYLF